MQDSLPAYSVFQFVCMVCVYASTDPANAAPMYSSAVPSDGIGQRWRSYFVAWVLCKLYSYQRMLAEVAMILRESYLSDVLSSLVT